MVMFTFAIFSLLAFVDAAKFPKNWTSCKLSDPNLNNCLQGAVDHAIHDLVGGNQNLGVLPLDPFHFNAITIDQGSGPVSIKLDFVDLDVTGFKDLKVNKVITDWKHMEVDLEIPTKVVLDGMYKIKGQVLVLPINGDGHCRLELEKFAAVAQLKYSQTENGGKKYYNLDDFDFKFDTTHMQMNFENLFNGDKALGDNMNVFLNENWKEILHELKPAISSAFGAAFAEVGNRIFSKIEIDAISPP